MTKNENLSRENDRTLIVMIGWASGTSSYIRIKLSIKLLVSYSSSKRQEVIFANDISSNNSTSKFAIAGSFCQENLLE